MADTSIDIPIDSETAQLFLAADPTMQQKIRLLLRLRLREITQRPRQSLPELMDEIGANAQRRGVTPEIVEELLRDA